MAALPVNSKAALATCRFSGKLVSIKNHKFIWYSKDSRAVLLSVLLSNGFGGSILKWLTDGTVCYAAPLM